MSRLKIDPDFIEDSRQSRRDARSKGSAKNNILVTIILAVVVGVAGFFAGMKYQQSKQPSRSDFQSRMGMRQGTSGVQRPAGSEVIRGEIIDRSEGSITVKLPDGSSKIILIAENTTISKATEGTIDDLKNGEPVMVFGQTNSDGSVSVAQIQLGSGFRPGQGPQAD